MPSNLPPSGESHIEAAFRRLAKQHHPDVQPKDEAAQLAAAAKMAELVEAYDALLDDDLAVRLQDGPRRARSIAATVRRRKYDRVHDISKACRRGRSRKAAPRSLVGRRSRLATGPGQGPEGKR